MSMTIIIMLLRVPADARSWTFHMKLYKCAVIVDIMDATPYQRYVL